MSSESAHRPTATVVIVSDRSAAGLREDLSGPVAVELLLQAGFHVPAPVIVPDGIEHVRAAIIEAGRAGARFVVTAGGTGVAPRDLTPEATKSLLARELPGIPELLRRSSPVPHAALSRGLAGITDHGVIVLNLPGSPRAVDEGLSVVLPLLPHLLDQLAGGDHP